ncbi:Zn-finger containing NTP pyrophosphohydrolase [Frankia torreyi]|uniref:NAD(+) diphosphatase n=1 Tax=Frankia torreyi TaxID=1856 RepID=A0A0D8BEG4_9ACTN|nr:MULTISPECIES: NAD(+) diphosphatase [Frankia]KJE22586.1 Zn-finger containing NTP pyrophosphohydrolase [Frankia torreyi]
MTDFGLVRPPVLAGAALLRDEPLRQDTGRQKEAWATARVVLVDEEGRSPVRWGPPVDGSGADAVPGVDDAGANPRLWMPPATEVAGSPPPDALLLGEADGVAYWAVRGGAEQTAAGDEVRWLNLFSVGAELGERDAALLAAGVALLNWHGRAQFCAHDGSPTRLANAGWARVCEAQHHEEYPRTDPAVICLVHDGADRMLLGRHRAWPAGRFSVLAGFVEAGESLEACVAREIGEEVGLDVTDIRYLGSQAWPFPRSLMLGFHAVADPAQPLRLDETEISEALWVTRDEVREALARGDGWATADDSPATATPPIRLPGRMSIARTMIDSWSAAG